MRRRPAATALCRTLVYALGALLLPASLFALDPTFALSQYAKRHWQVEQGLPQNYVTSLTLEPGGMLVVGTSGGVARFDGSTFYPVVLDEATGISREWINAVAVLPGGALWISSRDADIYLQENGRVRSIGRMPGQPSAAIVRRDGSLAAVGTGFWEFRDGRMQRLLPQGGGDLSWQGILELDDGGVLMCANEGLYVIEGAKARMLLPSGSSHGRPLALARGRNGGYLLGTTAGLFRLTLVNGARLFPLPGVEGPIVSIVEDRDGLIWAASWGKGIFRIRDGQAQRWTQQDGLDDDFVHTLLEDEEGSLWIGSRSGLSRWRSGPIVPYGPREGLDAQFLSSIAGDSQGRIWVGTWRRGLHRLHQGRFETVPTGFPEDSALIRSMAFAGDDRFWISDWFALHHVTRQGWTRYTSEDLGFSAAIQTILVDRTGRLWLGGNHGLTRYPGGAPSGDGVTYLAEKRLRQLLEARDGVVWATSQDGLFRFDGSTFQEVAGLPHPSVSAICEDSRGNIWVATRANGVVRIAGDQVSVIDQRHGLPDLPIYAILEDHHGRLWMSSPRGLFAAPRLELDAVADRQQALANPVPFRADDGLRTIEFQNVGAPLAWRDQRGHLWFPSVRGLVEVRPDQWQPPAPPRILMAEHRAVGRTHEVRFTASHLGAAEMVEFRYRLQGWQRAWIPLGNQHSLRLDSVSPGEHVVEIAARMPGSAWGAPAVVRFYQPPRWFETRWFYAGCLAALFALLWGAYRWRVRQVRARFALVAAERNRIGREWHDTLLAGFSAISWQLEAALRALHQSPEAAANAVGLAGKMVNHYRTEARRVIWDLRHAGPEHEALDDALDRTLREIVRGEDVERLVKIEGEASAIPADLSQGLLRICQEAALNASRHADARRIEVSMHIGAETVQARITDDGRGFDPTRIEPGHFGLAIMRERAERFGGCLRVESAPGEGTTIAVELPLHGAMHDQQEMLA